MEEIEKIVNNVKVYGLNESIKRAKYPKSVDTTTLTDKLTPGIQALGNSKQGEGHDQFLTGIVVQFDLTFTIKEWTEAERYHFFDFVSSQSTMHKITKFDLDKSYIEYVDQRMVEIMKEKVKDYNDYILNLNCAFIPQDCRTLQEIEGTKRRKYLEILYSNPCGFKLTAGITTNYRQLKTIYKQRRNHRLPNWRTFCRWIETLPMFKELCLKGEN